MAKKKQTKGTVNVSTKDYEKLEQEIVRLNAENTQLLEALHGPTHEATAHSYPEMTATHQPIIVEEVAAMIPLLKDVNGQLLDDHNFSQTMPQLVRRAIQGVVMVREALAEHYGESAEVQGEEIGDEVD